MNLQEYVDRLYEDLLWKPPEMWKEIIQIAMEDLIDDWKRRLKTLQEMDRQAD